MKMGNENYILFAFAAAPFAFFLWWLPTRLDSTQAVFKFSFVFLVLRTTQCLEV